MPSACSRFTRATQRMTWPSAPRIKTRICIRMASRRVQNTGANVYTRREDKTIDTLPIGRLLRTADRHKLLYRLEQLVQPERLVKHGLEAGLAGLDDGMARVVAKSGHQRHRNDLHHLFELKQEVETTHIREPDIGDNGVVVLVGRQAAGHELCFAAVMGCFDDAAIPLQKRVSRAANALIGIHHQNPPSHQRWPELHACRRWLGLGWR